MIMSNVDFTNGRAYNQFEHARAMKSIQNNYITTGLDLTASGTSYKLTSGTGVVHGYPVQVDATTLTSSSSTAYIYIKVESTLTGDMGTGKVTLGITSSRNDKIITSANSETAYFTIYKIGSGKMLEDYRHQATLKSVQIDDTDDNFSLTINGVQSNTLPKPLTNTLENYTNVTATSSSPWKKMNGSGLWGGSSPTPITVSSGDSIWNYDVLALYYENAYTAINLNEIRGVYGIERGSTTAGTVIWNVDFAGLSNMGETLMFNITIDIRPTGISSSGSCVTKFQGNTTLVGHVNSSRYAPLYYALLKRGQ